MYQDLKSEREQGNINHEAKANKLVESFITEMDEIGFLIFLVHLVQIIISWLQSDFSLKLCPAVFSELSARHAYFSLFEGTFQAKLTRPIFLP